MATQRRWFDREGAEFGRGLGFFDAIYGFAITLLIANVDVPPAESWRSIHALLDHGLGSQLLGFAISFIVIAVFWRTNTRLVARFKGMDTAVIAANLVITFFIVILPFSTQGISDTELSDLPLPTALYAANVAAILLAQMIMFEIARARGLVADDVPKSAWWARRVDVLSQVGLFIVSIPIAYFVSADWGKFTWLLLLVSGPVLGKWSDRVAKRAQLAEAARLPAPSAGAGTSDAGTSTDTP